MQWTWRLCSVQQSALIPQPTKWGRSSAGCARALPLGYKPRQEQGGSDCVSMRTSPALAALDSAVSGQQRFR